MTVVIAWLAPLAHAACDIEWQIVPRLDGSDRRLEVTASWRAGPHATTDLHVSHGWGGIDDFAAYMRDFRALSDHQWVLDRGDPNTKTVTHLPNERIRVRYVVVPREHRDQRIERRDAYGVILGADWFHFTGYAVFAMPDGFDDDSARTSCVTLRGVRDDAWIVSSFDARAGGPLHFRVSNPSLLRHAVYFGGRMDVVERSVNGRRIVVAREGSWDFSMDAYADAVTAIIGAQRAFWRDDDLPYYAVELLSTGEPQSRSTGGTGLHQAFLMYEPAGLKVPGAAFEQLVAHEHMHTWIARRFGGIGSGEEEAIRYWFSEGFTDYYAHRSLVQAGRWTLQDYAETLNRRIEVDVMGMMRGVTNEVVARNFFATDVAGQVPYVRGELLALHWDAALRRQQVTDLDAVMRSLLLPASAEQQGGDPTHARYATARLMRALSSALGAAAARDVDQFIERGESLSFGADELGPCFEGAVEERPAWSLGFAPRSLIDRRVSGVDPAGAAFASGLRNGQRVEAWGIYVGDTTRDITIGIRAGDQSHTVVYSGRMPGTVRVPVFRPRVDALSIPACRAWAGPRAH